MEKERTGVMASRINVANTVVSKLMRRLVRKYFKRYFKNFNEKELSLNLAKELKETILSEDLGLPACLVVTRAVCYDLTVKIPWRSLKSESISVSVGRLHVEIKEVKNMRSTTGGDAATEQREPGGAAKARDQTDAKRHARYRFILECMQLQVVEAEFVVSFLGGGLWPPPPIVLKATNTTLAPCNKQYEEDVLSKCCNFSGSSGLMTTFRRISTQLKMGVRQHSSFTTLVEIDMRVKVMNCVNLLIDAQSFMSVEGIIGKVFMSWKSEDTNMLCHAVLAIASCFSRKQPPGQAWAATAESPAKQVASRRSVSLVEGSSHSPRALVVSPGNGKGRRLKRAVQKVSSLLRRNSEPQTGALEVEEIESPKRLPEGPRTESIDEASEGDNSDDSEVEGENIFGIDIEAGSGGALDMTSILPKLLPSASMVSAFQDIMCRMVFICTVKEVHLGVNVDSSDARNSSNSHVEHLGIDWKDLQVAYVQDKGEHTEGDNPILGALAVELGHFVIHQNFDISDSLQPVKKSSIFPMSLVNVYDGSTQSKDTKSNPAFKFRHYFKRQDGSSLAQLQQCDIVLDVDSIIQIVMRACFAEEESRGLLKLLTMKTEKESSHISPTDTDGWRVTVDNLLICFNPRTREELITRAHCLFIDACNVEILNDMGSATGSATIVMEEERQHVIVNIERMDWSIRQLKSKDSNDDSMSSFITFFESTVIYGTSMQYSRDFVRVLGKDCSMVVTAETLPSLYNFGQKVSAWSLSSPWAPILFLNEEDDPFDDDEKDSKAAKVESLFAVSAEICTGTFALRGVQGILAMVVKDKNSSPIGGLGYEISTKLSNSSIDVLTTSSEPYPEVLLSVSEFAVSQKATPTSATQLICENSDSSKKVDMIFKALSSQHQTCVEEAGLKMAGLRLHVDGVRAHLDERLMDQGRAWMDVLPLIDFSLLKREEFKRTVQLVAEQGSQLQSIVSVSNCDVKMDTSVRTVPINVYSIRIANAEVGTEEYLLEAARKWSRKIGTSSGMIVRPSHNESNLKRRHARKAQDILDCIDEANLEDQSTSELVAEIRSRIIDLQRDIESA